MRVIIINGPMGAGKTAVGRCIADMCPRTAFIDGDWCMDLHPFVGSREMKDIAVDNILHMISNYRSCSVCDMVVVAWLMDEDRVRDELIDGIRSIGAEVETVTLVCDEGRLRERWQQDKSCPWRTDEWLKVSLRSLSYFRDKEDIIDTTSLSVEDAAKLVMQRIGG